MRRFLCAVGLVAMLFSAASAAAHHPGHAVSVRTAGSYNPYLEGTGKPRKSVNYTFDWSHLDNGAGDMYFNQVGGEYAVVDWLSLTARIPVLSLQMNFRPNKTGLGDVAAGVKGLLWGGEDSAVTAGLEFSFPTGDRDAGTGAGAVSASPFVAYQYDLGPVQFFTSLGTSVLLAGEAEPILQPLGGLAVPLIKKTVPVTAIVSLRGIVYFADETFTPGSAKGYLVPGLIIYPRENKKLSIAVAATISVIDTLAVRQGVIVQNSSLALTQDVKVGASLEMNYNF